MFTNILCATDGSADAARALHLAAALATDAGTTIDVVHVVEYYPAGRVAGLSTRADEAAVKARVEEQIADAGVRCTAHMPHAPAGKTARRIADLAVELGSDVIVVGTRGHSAVAGAMLGSVTQRLLHEASCPVLAVPPTHAPSPASDGVPATAAAE